MDNCPPHVNYLLLTPKYTYYSMILFLHKQVFFTILYNCFILGLKGRECVFSPWGLSWSNHRWIPIHPDIHWDSLTGFIFPNSKECRIFSRDFFCRNHKGHKEKAYLPVILSYSFHTIESFLQFFIGLFAFFPRGITTKTPRHKEERKERQWSFLGSIHLGTKHNSCTPKTLLYGSSQKVYDPQVDAPDLDGISSGIISLK